MLQKQCVILTLIKMLKVVMFANHAQQDIRVLPLPLNFVVNIIIVHKIKIDRFVQMEDSLTCLTLQQSMIVFHAFQVIIANTMLTTH